MAFETLEPRGERRADLRAALIAQTIFNANVWKRGNRAKLSDFMLRFEPEELETPQQAAAKAKRWAEAMQAADQMRREALEK